MKKILFSLLIFISFLGHGQEIINIPQPKCEEINGMNFNDVIWTEDDDGVNYPSNFPQNGVVKMCNENGYVTLEMKFKDGENVRDRFWEDWGMKLRFYTEGVYFDKCFDKNGKEFLCDD